MFKNDGEDDQIIDDLIRKDQGIIDMDEVVSIDDLDDDESFWWDEEDDDEWPTDNEIGLDPWGRAYFG